MKYTTALWRIAFAFLIIAGLIGVLMRFQFFSPTTGFNYQYLLHTHSHVVLLGWVLNALIAALHYILKEAVHARRYLILYLLFQVAMVGMLLSFPVQGYAFTSIFFSTLHIFLSYIWVAMIWKKTALLDPLAGGFIRWGLFYLVVSTLGPFALAFISSGGNVGSNMYFMAIYFYLHFLYNGAFIFLLLGMFFWHLKVNDLRIDPILSVNFLRLMNVSCIAGLLLSALWMQPSDYFYWIGGLAGLIQLAAVILLIRLVHPVWQKLISRVTKQARFLLIMTFAGFFLKVILQALSAIPAIADLAYIVRNYTIGYLHLVFLGIVTPFLLAWFNMQGLMSIGSRMKNIGLALYFIGLFSSELVIVTQKLWVGIVYYQFLFVVSLILWVGIVLLYPRLNKIHSVRSDLKA